MHHSLAKLRIGQLRGPHQHTIHACFGEVTGCSLNLSQLCSIHHSTTEARLRKIGRGQIRFAWLASSTQAGQVQASAPQQRFAQAGAFQKGLLQVVPLQIHQIQLGMGQHGTP